MATSLECDCRADHRGEVGAAQTKRRPPHDDCADVRSIVTEVRTSAAPTKLNCRLTPPAQRVSTHETFSPRQVTHLASPGLCGMSAIHAKRRPQVSLRSTTTARPSDFRSALTRSLSFDGPMTLVPANDNGFPSGQWLDPRLQQLGHCEQNCAALSLACSPLRTARRRC
jgi:hypothetical protein